MKISLLTVFGAWVAAVSAFSSQSPVVQLKPANFDAITTKPNSAAVLAYYRSKGCKDSAKFVQEFEGVANELAAGANVVAFDCETYPEEHGCSGIKKFPFVKFFVKGESKEYKGAYDTDTITASIKDMLPADGIEHLLPKKKKYKRFIESHRDKPLVVLFNALKSSPPILRILNLQFSEHIHFAEVRKGDGRKIAREFGIKDFPSLGILPPKDSAAGDDDDDDDVELEDQLVLYPGKYKLSSIVEWVSTYAPEADISIEDGSDDEPLPVEQLSDESCMEALCQRGGLCAILITSIDPVKPNMKQLRQDVTVFKMTQDARKDNIYHFAWIDGISQMDFIDKAFHLMPQDYPQVVVLAAKKLRYANFVGAFSPDAVGKFLTGVRKGVIKTNKIALKTLPALEGDTKRCIDMKPPPIPDTQAEMNEERARKQREKNNANTVTFKARGFRKGGLIDVTADNFDNWVKPSRANWMMFLSFGTELAGEAGQTLKEFKRAAKAMKNMVRFAIFDMSNEDNKNWVKNNFNIELEGEESYRIISLPGGKKIGDQNDVRFTTYTGENTGKALKSYAQKMIQDSTKEISFTRVTKVMLPQWMQGSHVLRRRLLLLTESEEIPLLWRAIVLEYEEDEIVMGVSLKKDKEIADQFNVKDFPALLYLQGEPSDVDENGQASIGLQTAAHLGKIDMKTVINNVDQMLMQWEEQKVGIRKKYGYGILGERNPDEGGDGENSDDDDVDTVHEDL